jgi:hypothetical protein
VRATSRKFEPEDGIHLVYSVVRVYLIVVISELRWMLRKKSEWLIKLVDYPTKRERGVIQAVREYGSLFREL